MNVMKDHTIGDVNEIKKNGRVVPYRSSVALFWTGSGITITVKASELWIEAESDYTVYEPWISILINGVRVSRIMIQKGRQWICLFRGMNTELEKTVEIKKDTQAMAADNNHYVLLHTVRTDGELLKTAALNKKIEFIGDSITSGEGIIGAKEETDWISMWFDSVDNYATMTAKKLKSECSIISQSGWGVYCGWDNTVRNNIPDIYELNCGACSGDNEIILAAKENYDFNAYQPDAIVINLGTNDTSAFSNEGWLDTESGVLYKLHKNEDDSFCEADALLVKTAVIRFLKKLRCFHKSAYLVWAYGILGTDLEPYILQAITQYRSEEKDERVHYCRLPLMTDETTGARWHPGKAAHELVADTLTDFLNKLIST